MSVNAQHPVHLPGRLRLHRPGSLIGGAYRVEQFLGQGGLGAAYEVEHRESRTRWVCKEMDLLAGPEALPGTRQELLESFVRDCRSIARLHDPAIPPAELLTVAFDRSICGFCGNSFPGEKSCPICRPPPESPWYRLVLVEHRDYLLVRQIPGQLLSQRHRARSWSEVLPWFRQICGALSEMHATGLLHLNVKPENVLFEAVTGRAFVMDLGQVKCVGPTGDPHCTQVLSARTLAVGTPGYAAPELYRAAPVAATDVYALGMLLCWALTGRDPCEKDHELELISVELRSINPSIPAAVSAAIARSLKRVPSQRFESVGEFLEALQGSLPPQAAPIELRKAVELEPEPAETPVEPAPKPAPPPAPAGRNYTPFSGRLPLERRPWYAGPALPLSISAVIVVVWGVLAISVRQAPPLAAASPRPPEKPRPIQQTVSVQNPPPPAPPPAPAPAVVAKPPPPPPVLRPKPPPPQPETVAVFSVGEPAEKPPEPPPAPKPDPGARAQTLGVLARAAQEATVATVRLLRLAQGSADQKEIELALQAQAALDWLQATHNEARKWAGDRERPEFKLAQSRMMDAYIDLGDRNMELGEHQRKTRLDFPWEGWEEAVAAWPKTRSSLKRQVEELRRASQRP